MLLRTRKTSNLKPQTSRAASPRFESLESRLCLSGCDISGNVYDARFNPGEQPLSGVQVFLDLDQDGEWADPEPWAISDENGDYSFEGLQPPSYPFTYTVAETVPAGYIVTTPVSGTHSVTFNQEGTVTDKDFGNTPGLGTQKVDVFFVCDATGSLENPETGVFPEVIDIVDDLTTAYPDIDWAFGLGRFAEYASYQDSSATDRPFILNQPIIADDHSHFEEAITKAGLRNAHGYGGDAPETATEALYQIATGAGFDGNDDGDTTDSLIDDCYQMQTAPGSSGDVIAFSEYPEDPEHDIYAAAGTLGGVGFRGGSIAIVIVTTDAGTRYEPEDPAVQTVHGVNDVLYSRFESGGEGMTPNGSGAAIVETVDALTALGIRVIGLGDETEPTDPRPMLEAYAEVTGAVNNGTTTIQNGTADPIAPGDPLYFNIADASLAANLSSGILDQMVPEPACMTGIVYKDLNDDGIRNAGEPGEQYRTVYIDFDNDGVLDPGEYHTQTDASGEYTFENLPLGGYRVRVVLPAGYGHTPPGYEEAGITYVNSGAIVKAADIGIQEVTAHPDYFTTPEDTPLDIPVGSLTTNDDSETPDSHVAVSFSAVDDSASVGNVSINGSTVTYTPAENWHGTDTFLYSLTGANYTDWEVVTVEVTPVNDAPDIDAPTELKMIRGETITRTFAVTDVEGGTLSDESPSAEHGTFTVTDLSSFNYTPDPGFVGVERLTLAVSDGTDITEHEVAVYVCDVIDAHDRIDEWRDPALFTESGKTRSGAAVASDDGILVLGDTDRDGNTVVIYRETEEIVDGTTVTQWEEVEELSGGSSFGYSVAVRGDTLVVGEPSHDYKGRVLIYQYDAEIEAWQVSATLTAEDDEEASALFGESVAIDDTGNTIVVGAPSEEASGAYYAGAVYVFKFIDGEWTRDYDGDDDKSEGRIQPTSLTQNDAFGSAVDVSGGRIIVGARGSDPYGTKPGALYLFDYDAPNTAWVPATFANQTTGRLDSISAAAGDQLGCSVAIDGDIAVAGAYGYDYGGYVDAGKAVVLDLSGASLASQWLTPNQTEFGGGGNGHGSFNIGRSVDVLDNRILIGTPTRRDASRYLLPGVVYEWDSGACTNPEVLDSETLIWNGSFQPESYIICSHQYSCSQTASLSSRGVFSGLPGYRATELGTIQGGAVLIAYDCTPAAEDYVFDVTGAGLDDEPLFGIDPFEADGLTFSIVDDVDHGTLTPDFNNLTFDYTPDAGYRGGDTFTYRVAQTGNPDVYDEATVTLYVGTTSSIMPIWPAKPTGRGRRCRISFPSEAPTWTSFAPTGVKTTRLRDRAIWMRICQSSAVIWT